MKHSLITDLFKLYFRILTDSSSSLYLFTFLITIVVLAVISGGLLLRAYYVRRQFQRRVEEAIRAGQPLPDDAAAALGLRQFGGRNAKKEKKHGPMPGIWEAEMWRDGQRWEVGRSEKAEWDDIVVSRPHPRSRSLLTMIAVMRDA